MLVLVVDVKHSSKNVILNCFALKKSTYIALLLLIVGGCIYATCRQDVIFLAPFYGTAFLELIKIDIQYQGNIFVYFLLFVLADILWYLALLLIQAQFYNLGKWNKVLFYFAVTLPFIHEFGQYFNIFAGTFDIVDVIAYILTFLIFMFVWKRKSIVQKLK